MKHDEHPYGNWGGVEWNSNHMKKIRKDMVEGAIVKGCEHCYDLEDMGFPSYRTNYIRDWFEYSGKGEQIHDIIESSINNDYHVDTAPMYLDFRLGNMCNLKCRMCQPQNSSQIQKEYAKIEASDPTSAQFIKDNFTWGQFVGDLTNWEDDPDFLRQVEEWLPGVCKLYFTGGEPTINLKHRELLDYYIDRGTANEVILDYNTNMAGVPSKVFNQWKYFKEVHVGMSIDGIYEHFEYIRHPGKFSTVEKNMRRLDSEEGFDRLVPSVTLTLSTMNVLHFLDMQWWMKEQNWKRINQVIIIHNLYGPEFLNIQNLPTDYKMYIDKRYKQYILAINRRWNITDEDKAYCKLVEIRLNSILTHMWDKEGNKEEFKRLWETTHQLDKIRNESWQVSMPEFEKMMKECNENRKTTVRLKVAGKK